MSKQQARQQISMISGEILSGGLDVIEGCRRIISRVNEAGLEGDPGILTLASVDSQADHIPKGESRTHYAKEYLERVDADEKELLEHVQDQLSEALLRLKGIA